MGKPSNQPLYRTRVLLAEDNDISMEFFSTVLSRAGAEVTMTMDGRQALQASRATRFDVLVFDLQMPIMTGTEVADCIRSEPDNPNQKTPMVALTAHIQAEQFDQILTHGFACCRTKPISKNELIDLVGGQARRAPVEATSKAELTMEHSVIWDRETALVVTGGDASVALDMLGLLARRLADQCGQVRKLIDDSSFEQALKLVHKLHGSAQFCACKQLAGAAGKMEKTLLSKQRQKLPEFTLALEQAAQAVLAEHKILSHERGEHPE